MEILGSRVDETQMPDSGYTALYLYGVVPSVGTGGESFALALRGIDGARVDVVVYRDIGILTHACAPLPYEGDVTQVHAWVLAQHEVIRSAHAEAGTILPIRFNSIIAPTADRSAAEVLIDWLESGHDELATRLAALRDRVELGVQVLAERTPRSPSADPGVDPATATSRGRAYFQAQLGLRQERERLRATEALTARTVFDELAARSDGIVLNPKRPQREGIGSVDPGQTGMHMLLDVALLAHPDKVAAIGRYLADVVAIPGLTVRYTGPWAPYAFAGAFDMPLLIPATSDPTIEEGARADA